MGENFFDEQTFQEFQNQSENIFNEERALLNLGPRAGLIKLFYGKIQMKQNKNIDQGT